MSALYYVLDGHEPREATWEEAVPWFARDRAVANDVVGEARVSTVFLVIDHGFGDGEAPVLFESMVFGGPLDGEQVRYRTWDEAERGHADLLARVKERKR